MIFAALNDAESNGVYPRAVVITAGVTAIDTGNVAPSFLAIEKLYATFCDENDVATP